MTPASKPPVARSRAKRRKGRGALAMVGGLLVASAVVRAGMGATQAFAADPAPDALMPKAAQAQTDATQTHVGDADIKPILDALNAREARLKKRESDVDIRMKALSVAEAEIERKLVALETAENNLRATLALAETAAEDDLTKLTSVYATMKPKQAAALFEQMDPQFSAGFLARMRPDAAAAIMAGLSPNVAYTISVILAGRNANVPKE